MEDKIIIEQYYNLKSCRAVAELYGCSEYTIRKILIENNIDRTGWKGKKSQTPRKKKEPVKYIKVCAYCNNEFEAKSIAKKYCCTTCKDIAYRISKGIVVNTNPKPFKKICIICGQEFETRRETTVCCSPKCSQAKQNARKKPLSDNYIKKQCVICGSTFTTKQPSQVTCGIICADIHKQDMRKKRHIRARDLRREEKGLYIVDRKCEICGQTFSCFNTETRKTCSTECSAKLKKQKRRVRDKSRELLKRTSKIYDFDITLETLYQRDNGICYICGKVCDWSDGEWRNGNFYTGFNYPTIEHITPLALGGSHSWDNVRLACFKCNIHKGVTTPTYTKEMALEDARKYARERSNNKKKTAQYTLDGELIRIWDSTAQIERELNVSAKYIQNICNRYKSKTGNAYGYHWEYIDKNVEHEDIKLKESEAV